MKITLVTDPIHYLLIENVYGNYELEKIWSELSYLQSVYSGLDGSNMTGSNYSHSKNNRGVFLDAIYSDRRFSNILTSSRKLLSKEILQHKESWFFKYFTASRDTTLVSYYETDDYYRPHLDWSHLTICTWIYKEPKKFTGGEFSFPDYNITLECTNNTAVAFPGRILHSVSPVKMDEDDLDLNLGRYCISQFLQLTGDSPPDIDKTQFYSN